MEEMAVVNDGAQVRLKEAEQLEMAFMCQKKKLFGSNTSFLHSSQEVIKI